MKFQIGDWSFDFYSALIAAGIMPIIIYAATSLKKIFATVSRYAIDGVLVGISRIATQRVAARISLRRYCQLQLAGPTRYLNVPGKSSETFLDIDQIFVPLVLERAGSLQTFGHTEAINLGNRIRITGDPGSGKSSVAKRLLRDECTKALTKPDAARLPLLVELRRLDFPKSGTVKKLGEWLYNHLLDTIKSYDIYQPDRCFSAYATASGLLIILDGLDEVSGQNYPQAEAAILGLSAKLDQTGTNNVIVLTMRTQFHLQVGRSYVDAFPISFSLKRFSPTDIYAFLMRWPFDSAAKTDHVIRIYNDLTDRLALREMCTNPLILSMYVAQDQATDHQLTPESRSDFYQQVTEELLIRRRAKQIGPSDTQIVLRRQRVRVLGKIAFDHLCDGNQPANLIPWEHGKRAITEIMGITGSAAIEKSLRELSRETGLISEEREGETFRFIHLTFCEFLAAMEATQGRSDGWDILLERHAEFAKAAKTRTRLSEVMPFAASLLPEHAQPRAIEDVERFDDYRMLALAFLETKRYEHPAWVTFIDRYQHNLIERSTDDWDSQWLAEVHLFLVVVADANRSSGLMRGITRSNAIALFFQHFAEEKAERLLRLIASYAEQDAASAFRVSTLCGIDILSRLPSVVVNNVDQPAFLAITIERAAKDSDDPRRWASLLAEAGLRSPASAALLSNHTGRPWKDRAASLPQTHQWSLPNFIPDSLYSDCLAIAHASDVPQPHLEFTEYFRRIRAPNAQKHASFHARFLCRRFRLFAVLIYFGMAIVGSSAAVPIIEAARPQTTVQTQNDAEAAFQFAERRRRMEINLQYTISIVIFAVLLSEGLFVIAFISLHKRCRLAEQIVNLGPNLLFSSNSSSKLTNFLTKPARQIDQFIERRALSRPREDIAVMRPSELTHRSFLQAGQVFISIRERLRSERNLRALAGTLDDSITIGRST